MFSSLLFASALLAAAHDGPDPIGSWTLNRVQAQGQTVGALSIQIAAVLSRYVEDPIVHVRMAHHGSRRVYVLGEVANPGIQKLDEFGLTLRDAVVRAGLPTEAAALGRVAVIQGPPGELRRRIIDLEEILNEGRLANNVTLMPNAVVYVPRSHSDWLMKSVLEPLIKLGAGAFVFFRLGEEAGLI